MKSEGLAFAVQLVDPFERQNAPIFWDWRRSRVFDVAANRDDPRSG